jgi:EAL domain-containing protein (putative c-di-GMP-specific phosphodiesterase class I)
MTQPFAVQGSLIHVTLSQGLALRTAPDVSLDELVRRADLAMYRAKQDRSVDAELYAPELDGHARRDREMELALRAALERPEEFTIAYQPVVHARGHGLVRAEALARWTSAQLGGPVAPAVFIPLAERTGLISRLGPLLLNRICADIARCPSLKVSINLSPVQLRDPSFLSDLDACLVRHQVNPERIEFEITEGVMIGLADRARPHLEALRKRGFSLALDDFGTGFSSMGYLTTMPFDTIKIDQVFLRQGEDLMKNLALIRSIVHLGHSIGKTMVCEGVEVESQATAIAESGCDELQGYRFARPMPLSSLVAAYPTDLALVA